MAIVSFKHGLLANLPASITAGTIYVTDDEHALYFDKDSSTRIRLGGVQNFPSITALTNNVNPSTEALYYVADVNCLAKWDGTKYIQINLDTGATSVDFSGDGNAVTNVTYDPTTRKLTFTKGATYFTVGEATTLTGRVSTLESDLSALEDLVGDLPAGATATTVVGYVDEVGDAATAVANQKVASVGAGNAAIAIGGTSTAPTVSLQLSNATGNELTIDSNGLFFQSAAADVYSVVKDASPGEYAAVYHLTKNGTNVGVPITMAKDMVVQSGTVVTNPAGQPAGTYIQLILANATNDTLYINVDTLIEYVTSGSQAGDMVFITINPTTHQVTATITDGTITLAKLTSSVQAEINKAHTHSNATVLDGISAADVAAWDAAEQNAKDYADTKDTALSTALIGSSSDAVSANTINGAKNYADDAVATALTWGAF